MSLLVDILMNVVNLLRNAFSRVLRRRPPDSVWLHITGSLPELDDARPNLLRPHPPPSRALRRRPPGFVWLHITGSLRELDDARPNLLRRHLDPWSSPPSLE